MYYIPSNHIEFAVQLSNFASKIGYYATLFNLSPEDVTQMQRDSAFYSWMNTSVYQHSKTKKGWIAFREIQRTNKTFVAENAIPNPVNIEPIPELVPPGIQLRFTTLVNRIKAHNNYSEAIGKTLGIEMSYHQRVSMDDAKPSLKLVISGGKVIVKWKKGDFDGIVIEKNSGNGFVTFDKSVRPNFEDPTELPRANQSAIWRYRAMYFHKNQNIGEWSNVVSITVGV